MRPGRALLYAALFAWVYVAAATDFYKVLGVSRSAGQSEIKRAFRKASRTGHPDRGGDHHEWVKITRAHEVLSDEEKRRVYDQQGEEGLKRLEGGQGGGGGGDPFSSFFNFFGGGQQQQQQGGLRKGTSLEFPLVVTLRDLYLGKEMHAAHRKKTLCSHCRGTGAERPEDVSKCSTCKGHGYVVRMQQLAPGFVQQIQQTCDKCGGKGKVVTSTCHQCHGHKTEVGEEVLTIVIEKGMRAGQKIVFRNMGDEQPEEQPGDVSFVIVEAPHETFRRDGDDLHAKLEITLEEALVGFTRDVVHLDGRVVKVARSAVTVPGQVISVPDEGMPLPEYGSEKGDLYLTVTVLFPAELTSAQRDATRALFQGWKFDQKLDRK